MLLGHAANDLNILRKLFHWSVSSVDESPVETKGNNTLVFTLIRLLTGKLYEVWQLFRKRFFATQLAKTYELAFAADERTAMQSLKQYFGKKNAIEIVRNQSAFHYSPNHVAASYAAVPEAEEARSVLG